MAAVTKHLLRYGVDTNLQDFMRRTPLMILPTIKGVERIGIAQMLLLAGADVNMERPQAIG